MRADKARPAPAGDADIPLWQPEPLFGQRIRALRIDSGRSQQDVAEYMNSLGFSWRQSTVAKTEAAERPIRVNEAYALAGMFGVNLDDLVRPDLHPLTARLQKEASQLAQAEQALADAERRVAESERRREQEQRLVEVAQKRVRALQAALLYAEWPGLDDNAELIELVSMLLEVFEDNDWKDVLVDAGYDRDAVEAAWSAANESGSTDLARLVAARLTPGRWRA